MGLISNGTTIFDAGSMSAGFGGSMKFIKKLTASSSSTLSFVHGASSVVLDSTFDSYLFTFHSIVPANDNVDFQFYTSSDTSSHSYDSGSTDYVEIYSLILVNFLNYCQSINFTDIKLKGEKKDEVYIQLICKIYNFYLDEVKDDLLNFDFIIPEFFDKEKFKINKELIPNKLTKEYLEQDSKLEYIFKIILGSFNKKRKKPIGIFTENTVKLFNLFVDEINKYIDNHLNKIHEVELTRAGLLDFDEFFDIQYDTDGDGEVYPDVFDEIQKGSDEKKKKKKDGGKMPTSMIDEKGAE